MPQPGVARLVGLEGRAGGELVDETRGGDPGPQARPHSDRGVVGVILIAGNGSTGRGTFGSAHAFPIRERCLLGSSTRQKVAPSDPDSREPMPPPSRWNALGDSRPLVRSTRRKRFPPPDPSGRSGPERNVATSLEPVNAMRAVGLQGDPNDVAGRGARVHDEERVTNDVSRWRCTSRRRRRSFAVAPRPAAIRSESATSTNGIRRRDSCRRAALGCLA
jgi:hypothetical protein